MKFILYFVLLFLWLKPECEFCLLNNLCTYMYKILNTPIKNLSPEYYVNKHLEFPTHTHKVNTYVLMYLPPKIRF